MCDLAGNVWEWVEDCYHDSYEGAPADGSAWTFDCAGALRVVRGGAWNCYARDVRAANRRWNPPGDRVVFLGFRPARPVP